MDDKRRLTGRQVTIIVVAIAVAAIGAPAGVLAASGTSVRLVDRSNSHHAAAVSKKGAVSVAVKGTPAVSSAIPAGAFTYSVSSANVSLDKTTCGTKFAITSVSMTANTSPDDAGLAAVSVGTSGNSSTGDLIAIRAPTNDTRELTFPQPLVLNSGKPGGKCKNVQLFEDGGGNSTFTVVGYRFH